MFNKRAPRWYIVYMAVLLVLLALCLILLVTSAAGYDGSIHVVPGSRILSMEGGRVHG